MGDPEDDDRPLFDDDWDELTRDLVPGDDGYFDDPADWLDDA